jgi:PKD repeat protein
LGQATHLSASVTGGSNVSYSWTFGDGSSGSGAAPAHTYPAAGTFTATVTAANPVGSQVASTVVIIEEPPAADDPITGLSVSNDGPTDLNNPITLTASVTGGTNINYDWNLGDGSFISDDGAVISHTYSTSGTFTVLVTATNSISSASATTEVTVQEPPDEPITGLGVGHDGPTAFGQLTTFTTSVSGGTNITYNWDLGDGTLISDGGAMISHTYPTSDTFTVIVTASNTINTEIATTTLTIFTNVPTLLAPENDSTQAQPTLDWSDVPNATSYHVQVSANSGFSTLLIDQSVSESEYTFTSTQTGPYFWRVAASDGPVEGPYSQVRTMQLVNYDGDDDGDALLNGWELHGYDAQADGTIEIDLPALGADYQHKDIFVEMDYMERASATNGLAPNQTVMDDISAIFANAPLSNPDGVDGINIHLDLDDLVPYDDDLSWNSGDILEFYALKADHFDAHREKIYHYMIWANRYRGYTTTEPNTIGVSRVSDFFVTLGHFNGEAGGLDEQKVAAFVHELGHNLGFGHGGNDEHNYKPNYFSIMNYWWAIDGISQNGGRFIDYQRFTIPNLNENNLNEGVGLNAGGLLTGYETNYYCPNGTPRTVPADGPIDWNCDGDTNDTGISVDINDSGSIETLQSQDDWSEALFDRGPIGP